ncbi:allatostatin-A receptor-like [Amphiura filiformis]|uniref:allatostatin-A receptor-like n=1 Tax=Amphiura filiformis TaxID=82378 RepID=UPI003B21CDDD
MNSSSALPYVLEEAAVIWTWYNYVQLLLAITGIVGNALVILIYFKNPKMRNTTNMLLVGLAVADLLTSLMLIPVPTLISGIPLDWRGEFYCKIVYSYELMWISITVSVFTLTMVSVERYLAISYPIKYRIVFSESRPKIVLICVWVVAVGFNLYSLFIWFNINGSCALIWPSDTFRFTLGVTLFVLKFVLPVVIMFVTHGATILTLRKHANELRSRSEASNSPAYALLQAKQKVVEMLFIVMVTFIVCWTPDQVGHFGYTVGFVPYRFLYGTAYRCFVLLAFFNSCVNPIIYAFKNEKFRNAFRDLLPGRGEDRRRMGQSSMGDTVMTETHKSTLA